MSDIIAVAGGLIGSGLSAKLLYDVLGPTAKDAGLWVREMANYKVHNLGEILAHAERAAKEIPADFAAHPRVAQKIIDEASMLDDPVMQAYAGYMLAASRTPDGGDDRALPHLDTMQRMSAAELRLHHIIYHAALDQVMGADTSDKWTSQDVLLPYRETLGLVVGGSSFDDQNYLQELIEMLGRNYLIYPGNPQVVKKDGGALDKEWLVSEANIKFWVTRAGMALFLLGHGVKDLDPRSVQLPLPEFEPRGPIITT